jgi:hypothetical protein
MTCGLIGSPRKASLEGKVMDKEGNTMINGKISIGNCVSRLILGILALWSIRQHHKSPGPAFLDDKTILMVQFKLITNGMLV